MKTTKKIPKVIHYCWFGGKEKPSIVKECIDSWHKSLSEYKIIEWNETNFDIHSNQYIKEAYEAKKFAFVSDYVRLYALFHVGGIYLDTDVKVFKAFDDLLLEEAFWGFEQEEYIATSTFGARKGYPFIKEFMELYHKRNFLKNNGDVDDFTNVAMVTKLLTNRGLVRNGKQQSIEGVGTVYPQEYFSPYDYINCRDLQSEGTYAMHLFYQSWLPKSTRVKKNIKKTLSRVIGGENVYRMRKLIQKK
ncbi:capsular polysaccharide synthesis protein [Halobacillus litoralis]|uniref:glycosyltransferase family 32 protein n=1 Tax=Halobacillus litoralis TaxID=45668 RepID=UPI001CFCB597|nr:capsular polysaccharide synthesis protein [Halobacillus litoralis]WLR49137.1 capsular polysaccharide synthesis protein [Halobacillus litoralis]